MDKKSNAYVMVFAIAVCATCAVVLAAAYGGFKDMIAVNERFDRQKNVLLAVGLYRPEEPKSDAELRAMFAERIEAKVLEVKRDTVTKTVKEYGEVKDVQVDEVVDLVETEEPVADLDKLRREESKKPDPAQRRELVPIYRRVAADGSTEAWCIPISGYGLWSTLYGFLALEPDLNTVKGITFFKHAETPGLGGEVDNRSWQAQWPGKEILADNGAVVGVILKKGKVDPAVPFEKKHMVDGLSGATITANGVSRFVEADLKRYEPYFKKHRKS